MWNPLSQQVSKNLVVAIPAAMILGFLAGLAGDMGWLKSLIVPFTFLSGLPDDGDAQYPRGVLRR